MAQRKLFWIEVICFLGVSLLSFALFSILIPPKTPMSEEKITLVKQQSLHYVAIGDSLTEGVGDTTKQGGFVPIVSSLLEVEHKNLDVVAQNFGVSGNTSTQILERVQKNKVLRQAIRKSQVITLTVGGNDVLKVIRENMENLSVETFRNPQIAYKKEIQKLLKEIRSLNEQATVYILGIYNPFYVNFSSITALQDVVDAYNEDTKEVLGAYQKIYFVPIDAVLSKGSGEQNKNDENDLLSDEDEFHPNDIGYQLMAKEVVKKMNQTKDSWLSK